MSRSVVPGSSIRLLIAMCLAGCAAGQQPSAVELSPEQPANVAIENLVLFSIRTRVGSFSPAERASAANEKLARFARDLSLPTGRIVTQAYEASTDILAGDLVVTTVTEADAKAAGLSRPPLSNDYIQLIRAGVETFRAKHSSQNLFLGALYAGLSTCALIFLLLALRHFAHPLYAAIERKRGTRIRPLKIQRLELASADRITELLVQAARLARTAITFLLFYFYIPLVFSFFPATRSFGATLLEYVFSPIRAGWAAFVLYLPSLLVIVVIAWFCYLVIRLARFFFLEIERGTISFRGFHTEWASPTYRICRVLILAFTLIVMFPYLPGSDSPAFKGVSIFVGVLFSLGSSSAVSQLIAGIVLTYTRAYRVGDRVRIADTVGDVVEKSLLATRVRTIKNVIVTVPNSMVLGSHIINFSASTANSPLILNTSVTIGYDAPWRTVHALLTDAATATRDILPEPKPFVLQTSLEDFYVSYELNAYTGQPSRMAAIYSELHQNIQDAFNAAGVEIMSPHYNAVRDGNATAIPEANLPRGYTPGGFRMWRTGSPSNSGETRGPQ